MLFTHYKIIIIICFLYTLSLANHCFSEDGYRRHFLSYGPSVKATALGETYVALGDDAGVVYYNPALLTTLEGNKTSVSNWFLYDGARYSHAGFVSSTENKAFGINGMQLYRDNIEQRTYIYDEPSMIKNAQTAVYVSFSKYNEGMNLHSGISLKCLDYSMYTYHKQGFSLDIGFAKELYKKKNEMDKGVEILSGLRVQNILQKPIKMIEEEEKLPFGAVLGLGSIWSIFPRYMEDKNVFILDKVKLGIDLSFIDEIFEYSVGAEYVYKNFVHLRAGWKQGITGGIGFIFKNLELDYAFLVKDFTNFNRVGISYNFGKSKVNKEEKVSKRDFALLKEAKDTLKSETLLQETRDKEFRPLFKKAKKNYDKKKYLQATDQFIEIMLKYPEQGKVKYYYSDMIDQMKKVVESEDVSNFRELSYAKGYMNYINQNIAEAVNEWNKVLQIEPKNKEVQTYLEDAQKYLNDIARKKQEKELNDKIRTTYNLGVLEYKNKNWVKTINTMEKVIKLCKKSSFPGAYTWNINAKEYIDKSLNTIEKETRRKVKKKKIKKEEKKKEVFIDKRGSDKKYREGLISYAHGKIREAVNSWEISVRLNPNNEKAIKALKKAKEELGVKKK